MWHNPADNALNWRKEGSNKNGLKLGFMVSLDLNMINKIEKVYESVTSK